MKKTPIKMLVIKSAWFVLAGFIALFSFGASTVIFWRSIEIVQDLSFTKWEEYGIVVIIGLVLMWLCSLAASSAESIILKQLKKRSNR